MYTKLRLVAAITPKLFQVTETINMNQSVCLFVVTLSSLNHSTNHHGVFLHVVILSEKYIGYFSSQKSTVS